MKSLVLFIPTWPSSASVDELLAGLSVERPASPPLPLLLAPAVRSDERTGSPGRLVVLALLPMPMLPLLVASALEEPGFRIGLSAYRRKKRQL